MELSALFRMLSAFPLIWREISPMPSMLAAISFDSRLLCSICSRISFTVLAIRSLPPAVSSISCVTPWKDSSIWSLTAVAFSRISFREPLIRLKPFAKSPTSSLELTCTSASVRSFSAMTASFFPIRRMGLAMPRCMRMAKSAATRIVMTSAMPAFTRILA